MRVSALLTATSQQKRDTHKKKMMVAPSAECGRTATKHSPPCKVCLAIRVYHEHIGALA